MISVSILYVLIMQSALIFFINVMAKTEKRRKGDMGEEVAFLYLKKNGYRILGRNCKNKFGEIDIVAFKPSGNILNRIIGDRKKGLIVFVEVKTQKQKREDGLYPERNVGWKKQRSMVRAAECYLLENNYPDDTDWQIDVIGVELDYASRKANLRHLKNAVST